MTTDEFVARIEKMGIKVTVDSNPSPEKVKYILEQIEKRKKLFGYLV